jgi:Spy/CpxP family protein refolding chaperone
MLARNDVGWANPKVITILALVFLCGSAFGAAAMRQYLHYRLLIPAAHGFVYHGRHVGFDTLKTDLALTPPQEQAVKQVLDDFAKYYQNLEEEREDVTEAGKKRIYAVLDPQQKERFAELLHEPPPKK